MDSLQAVANELLPTRVRVPPRVEYEIIIFIVAIIDTLEFIFKFLFHLIKRLWSNSLFFQGFFSPLIILVWCGPLVLWHCNITGWGKMGCSLATWGVLLRNSLAYYLLQPIQSCQT